VRKFGDPFWGQNLIYYSLLKDFYQWYDIAMNKQVVVNNLLISYNETLGGNGKALLFLHGWRSNKEVWIQVNQLISKSANQFASTYALDLPGFGGSQIPAAPMTVGDYANVVAQFIKKLDLKNVIILGHSFGGRVGIKLSSEYSGLIAKLVLVDSAGFAMDANKKGFIKIAAKIAKPFFKPQMMQGLRKKVYKQIGAEDYLATPELQKTFVNVTSEDLSEDMKKIKAPTLIVTGENDKDTPVEYGELMKVLIPNSKQEIIKNAGHFSFLDKPEEFISILEKFI
jgi:pimeloyl-ACP methyl ester carboxylesterase